MHVLCGGCMELLSGAPGAGTCHMGSGARSSAALDCRPENQGSLPLPSIPPKPLHRARSGQWCDSEMFLPSAQRSQCMQQHWSDGCVQVLGTASEAQPPPQGLAAG